MREVTPKELQELNAHSFKETQRYFRRRLREIAADGGKEITYNPDNYACGDQIKPWLEGLGFTAKQTNPLWCKITWPEEEDILEKLREETFNIWSLHKPIQFAWGVKIEREELGKWSKDITQYDYVCSKCGKHSMYKTDFCCNCGKKMKNDKE